VPNFRRGAAAIEERRQLARAAEATSAPSSPDRVAGRQGGEVPPLPHPRRRDPHRRLPRLDPRRQGQKANGETYTKYEQFISRKDPAIGESYDELQDRLDVRPKSRNSRSPSSLSRSSGKDDKGRERITSASSSPPTPTPARTRTTATRRSPARSSASSSSRPRTSSAGCPPTTPRRVPSRRLR
jgi:hypothetical protein